MPLQAFALQPMKNFFNERYYIPNYQREYAWEENELSDFLNDLDDTIARNDNDMHFFGQIVVHNDSSDGKKYIIDGQQRTTTSMIFLRVLQIFYRRLNINDNHPPAGKKEVLLSNYIGEYNDEEKDLHLTLTEADNDYFINEIILSEEPGKDKQKKKSWDRMRKAFKAIYTHISKQYNACNDVTSRMTLLNGYYNAFTEKFRVMYMEATRLDEAFTIFETLNARGKDLETADLLKNFIFSKALDIDDVQKKWNSMLSKLDKGDSTKYIRYFWNSSHSFTREKDLYRAISKNVKRPQDAIDLLIELDKYAQCFHDISFPEENMDFSDKKLVKDLKNMKTLNAKTFYPVILAMRQAKEKYTEADIRKVVEAIEVYVFRNSTICGHTANTSERFFADVAGRVFEDLTTSDLICNEIAKNTVSDAEFKNSFEIWTGSNRDIIRYVLRKLNKYLSPTEELSDDNNDVHIEHIMPEDNSKWEVDDDLHSEYLWRLGNLTLLSGKINKSISNNPFSEKVIQYKDSKIELNKALTYLEDGSIRGRWNVPDDIEKRQKQFAEYALIIWSQGY